MYVQRHCLFFLQTELNDTFSNTSIKIANLKYALELISKWESKLSVNNEENTKYFE